MNTAGKGEPVDISLSKPGMELKTDRVDMAGDYDGGVADGAGPGEDVEARGRVREVLLFDIVALRFQAGGEPGADGMLVAADGFDLDQIAVQVEEILPGLGLGGGVVGVLR